MIKINTLNFFIKVFIFVKNLFIFVILNFNESKDRLSVIMRYLLKIFLLLLLSLTLVDYTNNYGVESTIFKVEQNLISDNLQYLNIKIVSSNNVDSTKLFYYDEDGNLIDSSKFIFKNNNNKLLIQKFINTQKKVEEIIIYSYYHGKQNIYKKHI